MLGNVALDKISHCHLPGPAGRITSNGNRRLGFERQDTGIGQGHGWIMAKRYASAFTAPCVKEGPGLRAVRGDTEGKAAYILVEIVGLRRGLGSVTKTVGKE